METTRTQIAEAAAAEFLRNGYAGTSLSQIAARLDLTKGALSYHFPNKATFAEHFGNVFRSASQQALEFAEATYPAQPLKRILLYFLTIRSWRYEAQLSCGLALMSDPGSPSFGSGDVVRRWLDICCEAFDQACESGELVTDLSSTECAEMFLAINLGPFYLGEHTKADRRQAAPMRYARLGLRAIGIADADRYADEVIAESQERIPPLHIPGRLEG